jgi:ubiquinone/menaquinone biosynthesis C-methylase UbiE
MRRQEHWQLAGNTADAYEQFLVPSIFAPWARRLVALLRLQPGERVLDVACGTGVVARLAAQHVGQDGHVVGVDLNSGMLEVARSLPPAAGAVVEWREANALALPFPEAEFDVVGCQNGLQFFPDRRAALREMYRVLAPAGRLALLVWRTIDESPGFAALADALDRDVSQAAAMMRAPFAFGNGEELRALIGQAGFRDVDIRAATETVRFPSPEEFFARQVASSPLREPLSSVTDDVRSELMRDVGDRLRAFVHTDGLAFPMQAHLALAVR